jgi:DNA-binding MarR family transcriptional regulator
MSESGNDVKRPADEALAPLLGRALTAQAVAYYEALAERLGLNATDVRSLELLSVEADVTPGRLAELTGLTTGAVTGVLDRLEKAGLVEREPDPDDRRRILVRLVPDRIGELAATLQPLARATDDLLTRYAPAERAAIADYLRRAAGAVETETARLRVAARGGFIGDTYVAPLGAATRGRLMFDSGAPRVSMNVAPFGPGASARIIMETSASSLAFQGASAIDELVHGTFGGPLPDVRTNNGEVTLRYRRSPFASRSARLALNPGIPWTVELSGGITDLAGSLEGVAFAGLELRGGTNHLKLGLPAPSGTVPIRINGVASSVIIKRPAGVPVLLRVKGGISDLRLDAERHSSVSGDQRFQSEGFGSAPDRYEIEVLDGASQVRIGVL